MKNPDTIRLNWKCSIKCVDCGVTFNVESADPSVGRIGDSSRMILLTVPNECPECHNIRVVKSK